MKEILQSSEAPKEEYSIKPGSILEVHFSDSPVGVNEFIQYVGDGIKTPALGVFGVRSSSSLGAILKKGVSKDEVINYAGGEETMTVTIIDIDNSQVDK